ncbi:MAG: hypothetical protein IPP97_03045 [Candidatus Obscuribacter sp.]|jgi:ATP-dependent protease Clp ATPase subunit|nr:hypothetical protein [Candidatus Obscuribacter sp.]MBL0184692.1 hypothetical protein [Candidatus Obscuribacter sp.]MBP6348227.1 hypothetical protein [Candidatus Obscuribacter sp.]MBP6594370.1 hypothetical protein [Candidatus Obscuribacter sp.]MBP7576837.1 hypothetical protein [Candidatus Obscuribacter sp.]
MAGKDKTACSFCGISAANAELMIAKPGSNICDKCVYSAAQKLKDPALVEETELHRDCSFCSFMKGLDRSWLFSFIAGPEETTKGRKLIRGEKICICDDCVDLCLEIIDEHKARKDKKH